MRVEASLWPGSATGTTDLIPSLVEPPRYQARVFANNEGPRSVGSAAVDFQLRQSLQANVTAGRTLKQVLPDQAPWRLTARVSYLF